MQKYLYNMKKYRKYTKKHILEADFRKARYGLTGFPFTYNFRLYELNVKFNDKKKHIKKAFVKSYISFKNAEYYIKDM